MCRQRISGGFALNPVAVVAGLRAISVSDNGAGTSCELWSELLKVNYIGDYYLGITEGDTSTL